MLQGEFWITVNVNFLDIGVMEWRKLFGEPGGKHHWRRALSNPTKFYNDMLQTIEITNTDFEATIQKVKTYRDKFVAHLDNKSVMQIPKIEYAIKSVSYLYDYLSSHEEVLVNTYFNASDFYETFLKEGKAKYEQLEKP